MVRPLRRVRGGPAPERERSASWVRSFPAPRRLAPRVTAGPARSLNRSRGSRARSRRCPRPPGRRFPRRASRRTCSGLRAPTIAAVTPGQESAQAIATEATVVPCRSAIGRQRVAQREVAGQAGLVEVRVLPPPVARVHGRDPLPREPVGKETRLHGAVDDDAGAVRQRPGNRPAARVAGDQRRTAAGASPRGGCARSARAARRGSCRRRRNAPCRPGRGGPSRPRSPRPGRPSRRASGTGGGR